MCKLCGETNGCRPVGGRMGTHRELNADDWAMIYNFERYIVLPYLHGIIMRAREREGLEPQTGRRYTIKLKGDSPQRVQRTKEK